MTTIFISENFCKYLSEIKKQININYELFIEEYLSGDSNSIFNFDSILNTCKNLLPNYFKDVEYLIMLNTFKTLDKYELLDLFNIKGFNEYDDFIDTSKINSDDFDFNLPYFSMISIISTKTDLTTLKAANFKNIVIKLKSIIVNKINLNLKGKYYIKLNVTTKFYRDLMQALILNLDDDSDLILEKRTFLGWVDDCLTVDDRMFIKITKKTPANQKTKDILTRTIETIKFFIQNK